MFSELPKLLDRDFATGYFLPMVAFLGSSLVLLNIYGLLPPLMPVLGANTLFDVTVIGLVSWLGAISLLATNRDITRFMEGYGRYNPIKVISYIERRKYREVTSKLAKLKVEIKTRVAHKEDIPSKLIAEWDQCKLEAAERFPDDENWLLPTAFGNTLRAFEVYPRVMYGIESIQGWNRLLFVIPKDSRALIDSAKADVDFWLNVGLLSIGFILEYIGIVLYSLRVNSIWLPLIALALAWLASYRAQRAAVQWGDLVKASFDTCLGDLRSKLGFPPQSDKEKERDLWVKFSQAIVYRDQSVLREIYQNESPEATEGTG